MRYITLTLVFILALGIEDAWGENHAIDLACCSYHFDRDAGYNEANYGLLYRWEYERGYEFQVGGYKNSNSDTSGVIGLARKWRITEDLSISLSFGIVTGYEKSVKPYLLPTFQYKRFRVYAFPVDEGGIAASFEVWRW